MESFSLRHLLASRWLGLVAGMLVLSVAGSSYTFAIYSPVLKDVLGYDQRQISALAVAKDMGESVGLIAGTVCDFLPTWLLLLIGGLHNAVGYGSIWLSITGRAPNVSFWQTCGLLALGAQGTAYFNTAVLVTCVRNFPRSRGPIVGILKGLVGLSGAIFTQVYTAVYSPDQESFIFLVAVMPLSVVLITMFFLRPLEQGVDESEVQEAGSFSFLYACLLTLAAYLLVAMLMQDSVTMSRQVSIAITGGMVVLLLLPLMAAVRASMACQLESNDVPCSNSHLEGIQEEKGDSAPSYKPLPESNHGSCDSLDSLVVSREASSSDLATQGGCHISHWRATAGPGLEDSSEYRGPRNLKLDTRCNLGGRLGSFAFSPSAQSPLLGITPRMTASTPDMLSHCFDESILERMEDGAATPGGNRASLTLPVSELPIKRSTSQMLLAVGEGAVSMKRGPRRGEDFTLGQAIVKADFWLLFFSVMCGCGSGLAAINNLAQMGEAQGFSSVRIFVSLISIWNFLGRLGAGFVSEYLVRDHALPRTVVLIFAQSFMAVGHLLFALAIPGSMYIGSLIVGLCYGAHWAVMPATASEVFGLKHFGLLYNTLTIANPAGSYLFSGLVAGHLFDYEAAWEAGKSTRPPAPDVALAQDPVVTSLAAWLPRQMLPVSMQGAAMELAAGNNGTRGGSLQGLLGFGLESVPGVASGQQLPLQEGALQCHGAHCFRLTFFIMMGVCAVGVFLNVVLVMRTRRVYRTICSQRLPSVKEPKEGLSPLVTRDALRKLERGG